MASNKKSTEESRFIVESALKSAKRFGAIEAEVVLAVESGLSVSVRNGEIETLEYNKDKGVSVTVYIDQ